MRHLGRIALLSAIVMMMVACGSKQGKIIPRGRFAQLYASLFKADAWLESHSDYRSKADTTNFYLPILESYGYTAEDYRRSLDHYLEDPYRFAKIIEESRKILEKEVDKLQLVVDAENNLENYIRKGKYAARDQVMFDTLIARAGFTDRVDISMDEYGRYVFNKVYEDTSFFGPRLIIAEPDTTETAENLEIIRTRPGRLESIDNWLDERNAEKRKQRQSIKQKKVEEAQL